MREQTIKAVNWNRVEDPIDKATWVKLTEQFWLDTRIPVGEDMNDWNNLSSVEQELFNQVFAGLTLLDTLQSGVGAPSMLQDAESAHEEAVINNIAFMENIHAKSYSTIFSTFCSPTKIDSIFEWIEGNEYLQYKANIIKKAYEGDNPYKRKIASVMLESFLFYSGFYTPLRYLGMGKMANTAEIIKLINYSPLRG